jgi:hypothetical protein
MARAASWNSLIETSGLKDFFDVHALLCYKLLKPTCAGFKHAQDGTGDFVFPSHGSPEECAALKQATLVSSKLQQLAEKRGFTGNQGCVCCYVCGQ